MAPESAEQSLCFEEEDLLMCQGADTDVEDEDDRRSQMTSSSVAQIQRPGAGSGGTTPRKPGAGRDPVPPPKPDPKKKAKTGPGEKKRCKACDKWFATEDFPLNSPYCTEHKRAVDNLYRVAAAQKQEAWFAEVRQDQPRLKALIKSYEAKCPTSGPKTKRGNFSLVTFIEEYSASSKVNNTASGKMMWKDEFTAFAKKPKGGPSIKANLAFAPS